jgi:hypothetical protein
MEDLMCLRCGCSPGDLLTRTAPADRVICRECLEAIRTNVYEQALRTYPRLTRRIETDKDQPYGRSFDAYFDAKLHDAIQELSISNTGNRRRNRKKKRSAMLQYLPTMLTREELENLRRHAVCALTGSAEDVTLDHFIPLEWGHGGEYIGNIFFIKRELNMAKSNLNPFKWISKIASRQPIDMRKWDLLIRCLAEENGLSVKAFRRYVNWCEKNKRSLDQVIADNCPSLTLWKAFCSSEVQHSSVNSP